MLQEARHYIKSYGRSCRRGLVATILLLTTIVLQFASTILLSDLKSGPLGSRKLEVQLRPGLNMYRRITRDTAWTSNPSFYPTYGEYSKEPVSAVDGIAGAGTLMRALLPFSMSVVKSLRGD
jgi:hypothetical protein